MGLDALPAPLFCNFYDFPAAPWPLLVARATARALLAAGAAGGRAGRAAARAAPSAGCEAGRRLRRQERRRARSGSAPTSLAAAATACSYPRLGARRGLPCSGGRSSGLSLLRRCLGPLGWPLPRAPAPQPARPPRSLRPAAAPGCALPKAGSPLPGAALPHGDPRVSRWRGQGQDHHGVSSVCVRVSAGCRAQGAWRMRGVCVEVGAWRIQGARV